MQRPKLQVTVRPSIAQLIYRKKISVRYRRLSKCKECKGTGGTASEPCYRCHCLGETLEDHELNLTFSPNDISCVDRICTVSNVGHEFEIGERDDIIVNIKVQDDREFHVVGKDIYCHVDITPLQAMFGCKIYFPRLDGGAFRKDISPSDKKSVSTKWPDGRVTREENVRWCQSHMALIGKGGGGYERGSAERGDMIYLVDVCTEQDRDGLEKMAIDRIHNLEKRIAGFRTQKNQAERDTREEFEKGKMAAISSLAKAIIPSIDSLEKALEAMASPADEAHRKGVALILEMQRNTLAQHGIEVIPALGKPFDPNVHEAIAVDTESDLPKNTVTNVLQTGYRHDGKLFRASMVRVRG
ncbi:nucleotide exchange factor GrpE [Vreelandella rituensis]|uniref:Protein GrpE n=2 Tax=Vreelandella rituensis TaxID=2282306 RepID=A0A368UDD8_9GAMM|nr:nucleotide exchange factor GrpE [Halomonas rituensis]